MKVKFESSFEKDLRKIKNKQTKEKLKDIILKCKKCNSLNELNNIKKMKGYSNFYRLRIGDYRVGIELLGNNIIFTRFLHRKDIYKFFP